MVRVRDLSGRGSGHVLAVAQASVLVRGVRADVHRDPSGVAVAPAGQRAVSRSICSSAVAGGGAHAEVARDERTSRYQVCRAFAVAGDELVARRENGPPRRLSLDEAHHRRGRELATVVSDLDRRRVIEVLPGCQRKVIERWLSGLPADVRAGIEVVSIDPSEAYRQAIWAALPDARIVCDRFHLVRGANTALDAVRRERQRDARAKRPKGTRRSGQHVRWRPELYQARHRLLKASERLTERERRRLCDLFARDPIVAEAWGLKEAFRHIYQAASRTRGRAAARHVPARGRPRRAARVRRVRQGHPLLAAGAARLLRRADHQRLRRGRHQQGQGDQAPRLRTPHLRWLPQARRHSLRLTGHATPPRAINRNPLFNRRNTHCCRVCLASRPERQRRGSSASQPRVEQQSLKQYLVRAESRPENRSIDRLRSTSSTTYLAAERDSAHHIDRPDGHIPPGRCGRDRGHRRLILRSRAE